MVIPHFFGPSASLAGDIIPQLQLLKQKVPAWARAGAWGLSPVCCLLSGAVQALHGVCGGSALVLGKVDFQLQPPRRDPPVISSDPWSPSRLPGGDLDPNSCFGNQRLARILHAPSPFCFAVGCCMGTCGALHEHMRGTA